MGWIHPARKYSAQIQVGVGNDDDPSAKQRGDGGRRDATITIFFSEAVEND